MYRKLRKQFEDKYNDPDFIMSKTGSLFGLSPTEARMVLSTLSVEREGLVEDTTTNASDSVMPDKKPTNGDHRLGNKKIHKRKRDKKMKTFSELKSETELAKRKAEGEEYPANKKMKTFKEFVSELEEGLEEGNDTYV